MVAILPVALVHQTIGVIPLGIHRQVAQDVALLLDQLAVDTRVYSRIVAQVQPGVQGELVDGTQADEVDLVLVVDFIFHLALKAVEGGQKGKSDGVEQELQVATPSGNDIGNLLVDGPFGNQTDVARPYDTAKGSFVCARILLLEFKNRTEGVAAVRRESTGIEVDLPDHVDIDDADWPARAALGGEVIDRGHFHPIEVEAVLVGRPTTDDDVVAEARSA